jgi:hypothetical protein
MDYEQEYFADKYGFRFFSEDDIEWQTYQDTHYYQFIENLIGRFSPVFDHCDGNYDAADELQAAGVIVPSIMSEDHEYCQCYFYFNKTEDKTEAYDEAMNFGYALNEFLVDRLNKIEESYPTALNSLRVR